MHDDDIRALTLFELDDFRRMTQDEDKDLVLIEGPSPDGKTKTAALLPLLTNPRLRFWSRLCLDVGTACHPT